MPATLETRLLVKVVVEEIYPYDPSPITVLTNDRELTYPAEPIPPTVDTNKGVIELRYPTDPRPTILDVNSPTFTSPTMDTFPSAATVLTREAELT